jgi:murein DD-endopeptidase MepM/ murein hydrolase activator NlpD
LKFVIKSLILTLIITVFSYAYTYHKVRSGENLAIIAKKYGVSVDEIIRLNNLKKPYIIRPGQELKIPTKNNYTKKTKAESCSIYHKVKRGESLITIAKKYHVWVKDIKELNNLKSNTIRVGQVLCIKKSENAQNPSYDVKIKKEIKTEIVYHTVKKGESLSLIAKKYNTSVNEIIRLNNLKKPYIIRPGQKLKIPKKVVVVQKYTEEDKLKTIEKSMPFGFIWPVDKGEVSAKFINSSTLRHLGIDIKTECNVPIKAAESGKVIYAGNSIKAYGNLIIIKHPHNYNTVYGHVGKIAVKDGQYVKKGDTIGYTGTLNNSNDCGVYFEIRKNALPVDPLVLLPKNNEVKQ